MKINKLIAQGANLVTFSVLLPFVYGCNGGGGGGSASLGSLFAGTSSNPGGVVGGLLNPGSSAGGGGAGAAAAVATVHQPEPATMLLLGSGIAAMGLVYKKKKMGR